MADAENGTLSALQRAQASGVNLATREVFLLDTILSPEDVEGGTTEWLIPALRSLDDAGDSPVTLWIHTPGGDVSAMFAIYDAMRAMRCPVRTVAVGECCSSGVLLLVAGTAGMRFATPNATVMSHEPTGSFEGNVRASKERQRWLEWTQERWCALMAEHTPNDAAYWQRISEKRAEYWLLGGEAIKKAGLVDHVLSSFRDLLPGT